MTDNITTNSTLSSNATLSDAISQLTLDGWLAVSIMLSVGGSCLILLLLTTSIYQRHLYRGSKILITHLMLIQLIACAVVFPILIHNTYTTLSPDHPLHTTVDCNIAMFFYIGTTLCENWASLLLAINRYVAIMLPHHYRKWLTRRVLTAMMVLPWLMGFGLTLPVYYGIGNLFIAAPPNGFCTTVPSKIIPIYGRIFWVLIGSYSPIVLMGMIYLTLLIRLARGRYRVDPAQINFGSRSKRAKQIAIAKMLMVYYVWFCICYLPGPIIVSAYPQLFARYPVVALWAVKVLLLAGFAVSPVIFLALNSEYQTAVSHLFRRMFTSFSVAGDVNTTSTNLPLQRTNPSTKE